MGRNEAIYGGKIDSVTGSNITVDYPHHEIHDGNYFAWHVYTAAIAATSVLAVRVNVPTGVTFHTVYGAECVASAKLELVEGITAGAGAAMTVWNHNRSSSRTSGADVILQPASITGGSIIFTNIIGGGSAAFGVGGHISRANEVILNGPQSYLIRLTSNAASNTSVLWSEFYVE